MATKNSDETSEELHAEEELQGEPAPPTQKRAPSKIKSTIPVDHDANAAMVDTWGANNFPKAVRAKARAVMEETKEAAAKVAQAEAAAAVTELEQAELVAAAATIMVVSLTGEQDGGAPASNDCSAS